LLAVPAPAQAEAAYGEAFALAAEGTVAVAPVPYVRSNTDEVVKRSVAEVPGNSLLTARVLTASASATRARASVADLEVDRLLLRAGVITASCDNADGGAHLAKVTLGTVRLPLYPKPNTEVKVPLGKALKAEVTLNKQVRRPDGRLTVTAVYLEVDAPGLKQKIEISSVTCTTATTVAPPPTPIDRDLPVTG
jgi:hypothetical protein